MISVDVVECGIDAPPGKGKPPIPPQPPAEVSGGEASKRHHNRSKTLPTVKHYNELVFRSVGSHSPKMKGRERRGSTRRHNSAPLASNEASVVRNAATRLVDGIAKTYSSEDLSIGVRQPSFIPRTDTKDSADSGLTSNTDNSSLAIRTHSSCAAKKLQLDTTIESTATFSALSGSRSKLKAKKVSSEGSSPSGNKLNGSPGGSKLSQLSSKSTMGISRSSMKAAAAMEQRCISAQASIATHSSDSVTSKETTVAKTVLSKSGPEGEARTSVVSSLSSSLSTSSRDKHHKHHSHAHHHHHHHHGDDHRKRSSHSSGCDKTTGRPRAFSGGETNSEQSSEKSHEIDKKIVEVHDCRSNGCDVKIYMLFRDKKMTPVEVDIDSLGPELKRLLTKFTMGRSSSRSVASMLISSLFQRDFKSIAKGESFWNTECTRLPLQHLAPLARKLQRGCTTIEAAEASIKNFSCSCSSSVDGDEVQACATAKATISFPFVDTILVDEYSYNCNA